jgi:hypothetical protein
MINTFIYKYLCPKRFYDNHHYDKSNIESSYKSTKVQKGRKQKLYANICIDPKKTIKGRILGII